jgi:hypothetical protein
VARERAVEESVELGIGEEVRDRAALLEHFDALTIVNGDARRLATSGLRETEERQHQGSRQGGVRVTIPRADETEDSTHDSPASTYTTGRAANV